MHSTYIQYVYVSMVSSVFTSRSLLIYLQQFRHQHTRLSYNIVFFSVGEYIIIIFYYIIIKHCRCIHCIYYYLYIPMHVLLLLLNTLFSRGAQYAFYILYYYYYYRYVICLSNARRNRIETMPISFT